jgi:hypothetical protein
VRQMPSESEGVQNKPFLHLDHDIQRPFSGNNRRTVGQSYPVFPCKNGSIANWPDVPIGRGKGSKGVSGEGSKEILRKNFARLYGY